MGGAIGFMGSAVSAAGTIAGGAAANAAAQAQAAGLEFRAEQEEMAADEARAIGYRQAWEKRREGRIVDSRIQAVAASSGGGATDPTVLNIQGNAAAEAEYHAATRGYAGENRARGLEDQAYATRMTAQATRDAGSAQQQAAMLGAAGTVIGSAGSAFSKFGGGGTPAAATAGAPVAFDPLQYNKRNPLFGWG